MWQLKASSYSYVNVSEKAKCEGSNEYMKDHIFELRRKI